jgi:transcriptional repressor NrdR
MKCPFCNHPDSKVVDSRPDKGGASIRRRRECESCGKRFTSHERVEEILPMVQKKDGRREPFDRLKLIAGIKKACEKRPVSVEEIERLVDRLEGRMQESGEREISTSTLGEWVMNELHDIDEVAYVRFASVYRSFKDINEFMKELQDLLKGTKVC